jgi:uncharacterized membrane protein
VIVARVASRQNIARLARRERFASALWPVPTIFAIGALILAGITTTLDESGSFALGHERFLVADTDTALTLTSVVATGMLVFLGIVFSTTLVAIQLAASQYSPRAVRVFLRSRLTKVSLGVFVATFVFSVASLLVIRSARSHADGFTPVISMAVLSLLVVATLLAFLVFANGTARLLRVQYLIERIAEETRPSIEAAFPRDGYVDADAPAEMPTSVEVTSGSRVGVLDAIDLGGLAEHARAADGWIEIVVPIGSYLGVETPIAIVHAPRGVSDDAVRACLMLSNERTLLLDPGCGVRQLTDIAIRGLSPAVNDPTTAVQAIDRLADLLSRVAARPRPSGWYVDDAGVARLLLHPDTFEDLVRLAYVEIIRYGADSPQAVRRLRAAFDQLEHHAGPKADGVVDELRHLLDAAIAALGVPPFAAIAAVSDPRGLG